MTTTQITGQATRQLVTTCGRGIDAGERVIVKELAPGFVAIAPGGRRTDYFTPAQLATRVTAN